MNETKIAAVASEAPQAQAALSVLLRTEELVTVEEADVVVALGGDGFMLSQLQAQMNRHDSGSASQKIYGVNYGTLGFLMNQVPEAGALRNCIEQAKSFTLNPIKATVVSESGQVWVRWAFNEVAIRRQGAQSASLRLCVDGKERLGRLSGDGVLLSTAAGSAAYNLSAGGPVLPLGSRVLALTGICPITPRRWQGALLTEEASVDIEVLELPKRPVIVSADSEETEGAVSAQLCSDPSRGVTVLFDANHDLEERLLNIQFS